MSDTRACCDDIVQVKSWITEHDKRHGTIDDILDKLMNRLPLWATFAFTIGGGLIGSLVTIISVLSRR